ncbi:hypothetical protein KC19_2G205000 [Ceratodon purpureus]|uniref:Uncharacterized protein n=1 Tax=Ceratodon purpureus TaxID=3225 RepID=A0A8T0J006_CERPU|nr:hypothetical protein KC19_2G205000 [Ceratodon purpureus]
MCPGGEGSSSLDMEDYPVSNNTTRSSHSEDDIKSDMAGSLFELTPHPKNYMVKFLCDANGVQLPILGEYFGVALAFAALGALIRGNKASPSMKLSPKLQRVGLQIMLKNAMDRLQLLALNAHDLEQKVKDGKEATRRDIEAWDDERRLLVQKLSAAEAQVASVLKSRHEDAKANEKVVGIFASYEQNWKNEKKKLKREIELLRNEIIGKRNRSLRNSDGGKGCEECKSKVQELEKLEDKLCEKEFLMAAAMDEARSDQHERNQLAGKLAMVELCLLDHKDKLSKETAKSADLQVTIAGVNRKHEETEHKLMCAMSELESAKREIESITAAKMNQNAMIEELLEELTDLQKDVGDKEEIIAVLMKRSNIDRKEREELLHQLAHAKTKRKAAETEKDRWKRLAEERARNVPVGRDAQKARRSLGSKVEMDKLSEVQRSHNEEVHSLRSMYVTKLESLQEQLKNYEDKVALLESRIESQKRKSKQEERAPEDVKAKDHVNCHELVTLFESIVPDVNVVQQLDGFASEIQEVPMSTVALKDWLKQWLEVVKNQHAQHLEQRHWRELDAFERQMRLKDERLESFRWQLLSMESEFSKMKSELEMLKSRLAMAVDEKCRAERAVEVKDKELRALMKTSMLQNSEGSSSPDPRLDQLSHHEAQQRVLILLQKELNDAKKKLEVIEVEHQKDLLKVVEDTEAELRQKDHHLAVVEARLCQLRIQIDKEKRLSPKGIPDDFPEEAVPDKVYKIAVVGAQEVDIKNAISSACNEVEKLADQIAEVRKQMMESDDTYDNGLEALIDQATAVSNSGKKLSLLRNAISIEEIEDTRLTLFRDHQTASVHLETASHQTLQDLPSTDLETDLGHEILLHQRPVHSDEASISGAPEVEVSEDSVKSLDTDPEITSKREQSEDDEVLVKTMSDLEIVEDGKVTDEVLSEHWSDSAKKRGRRKTLEELFLDSPSELAVENAFQVQVTNTNARKDVSSFSSQGVLQAIEKNTLAEVSPRRNTVLNSPNPSQALTPLFNKTKSRRSEFNKTREEIQVLGLALEVRKIEEELLQIDKRCVSPPDVIINPRTGLGMPKTTPPKRFNKRYAALTGKVGQLAKQMGLTSERSPEMITDNPLFTRRPTTSEILSLQHRAEAVCQSLALIEAQDPDYPFDDSTDQQTGYSKERLVDTVKAHLSQVERSLSTRMEPIIAQQQSFIPNTAISLKERM